MLRDIAVRLTSPIVDQKASAVFCKSIVFFFLVKFFLSREVIYDIAAFHSFPRQHSVIGLLIYAPAALGLNNIHVFVPVALFFLAWSLLVRTNYFMAVIGFWLALSFYMISFPIANGSDQIMMSLMLLAIPISAAPMFKNERAAIVQAGLYNLGRVFCMIYVCSIYLISGLDKILSEAWRSGEAMQFIGGLRYMANPELRDFFPEGVASVVFSWTVILFELSFPVLVWFRRTRIWVLSIGVIFHLMIIVFLSLPDFGVIMILSYLIFLKDEDYTSLLRLMKLKKKTERN